MCGLAYVPLQNVSCEKINGIGVWTVGRKHVLTKEIIDFDIAKMLPHF